MSRLNCWFCNTPVAGSMCESQSCRPYYVIYIFTHTTLLNVRKVQFKTDLYFQNDLKEYIINYFPQKNKLQVVQQITHNMGSDNESVGMSYEFKTAFEIPYDSISLTPQNAQSRLPTLLLLS